MLNGVRLNIFNKINQFATRIRRIKMRIATRYGECDGCGGKYWLYHWKKYVYNDQNRLMTVIHLWFCWHCLPTRDK